MSFHEFGILSSKGRRTQSSVILGEFEARMRYVRPCSQNSQPNQPVPWVIEEAALGFSWGKGQTKPFIHGPFLYVVPLFFRTTQKNLSIDSKPFPSVFSFWVLEVETNLAVLGRGGSSRLPICQSGQSHDTNMRCQLQLMRRDGSQSLTCFCLHFKMSGWLPPAVWATAAVFLNQPTFTSAVLLNQPTFTSTALAAVWLMTV